MKPRRRMPQRGAAAIEMAFVLLYCFTLLPVALYFARFTLHGAVIQQAVQDAARFMATVPPEEILDPDRKALALAVARGMVDEAMASARLDTPLDGLTILCDTLTCESYSAAAPPATIYVGATLTFSDQVFIGNVAFTPLQQSQAYEAKLRYGY
jgi:Flp pilus assembly protein TadG